MLRSHPLFYPLSIIPSVEPGFCFGSDSDGGISYVEAEVPHVIDSTIDILTGRISTNKTSGRVAVVRSSDNPDLDFIIVYLEDGYMKAHVNLGRGFRQSPIVVNDMAIVSDGTWHTFAVRRLAGQLQIEVDGLIAGKQIDRKLNAINIPEDETPYFVAGADVEGSRDANSNFEGLIHGLRINERPLLIDVGLGVVGGRLE